MLTALALAATMAAPAAAASERGCAYTAGAATISVSGHPFAATPSSDGCWLFVSLSGEGGGQNGLTVLHNKGGRFSVERTIAIPAGAKGLALTADGVLLVAASGDFVRIFDVFKLQAGESAEVGRIAEGSGSATIGVALSVDDHLLFASDERAARITVSDFERGRRERFSQNVVIGRIPQGVAPVGLALSPDGAWLYATSERAAPSKTFPSRCRAEQGSSGSDHPEGALSIIDVRKAASDPKHALLAALPAGCNPVRVALTSDGSTAWVTARGENAVYSIAVGQAEGSAKVLRTR